MPGQRTKNLEGNRPSMPIAELIQEAADLLVFLDNDRPLPEMGKFSWSLAKKVERKMQELIRAEACYVNCKGEGKEASSLLQRHVADCTILRSHIRKSLSTFSKRHNNRLTVRGTSRNRMYVDLVQDLFDYHMIIKKNCEWLRKAGFDIKLGTTAARHSEKLTKMIAVRSVSKPSVSEEKFTRNRIGNELCALLQQARFAAQSLLLHIPERARRYHSSYYRRVRKRSQQVSKQHWVHVECCV